MSMTACSGCGKTIDCSGWDWYACDKCGAPIHTDCDKEWKAGDELVCPKCREKEIKESEEV